LAKDSHLNRSATQVVQMVNELRIEIAMRSQLGESADVIERLQSDPELVSRIRGREAAFVIAMREALANAVTHGNHHNGLRKSTFNTPANPRTLCRS
jgi:predicted HTH transcriptional regulator